TFNIPVLFSATITGLNLNGSNASFVYVDNNGGMTNVTSDASGISDDGLYVINAQLNHFSRYGWAK
ncbi:MAG: hypothetical protein CO128_09955, partial [Ignavibacteriales bacterium CG_4_9_14_3_um_filter_30_11]